MNTAHQHLAHALYLIILGLGTGWSSSRNTSPLSPQPHQQQQQQHAVNGLYSATGYTAAAAAAQLLFSNSSSPRDLASCSAFVGSVTLTMYLHQLLRSSRLSDPNTTKITVDLFSCLSLFELLRSKHVSKSPEAGSPPKLVHLLGSRRFE